MSSINSLEIHSNKAINTPPKNLSEHLNNNHSEIKKLQNSQENDQRGGGDESHSEKCNHFPSLDDNPDGMAYKNNKFAQNTSNLLRASGQLDNTDGWNHNNKSGGGKKIRKSKKHGNSKKHHKSKKHGNSKKHGKSKKHHKSKKHGKSKKHS